MRKKRLIVTGARGFIGSHATGYFKEKEYTVLGVDKLLSDNVSQCDLTNFDETLNLFKQFIPDYVIHLAVRYAGSEVEIMRTNLMITLNVLEASLKVGVKRLIYMSSSAVYGLPTEDNPVDEETPLAPRTGYGTSKVAAEYLVKQYFNLGLPCVIFRGFEVWGKGATNGIVKIFVENAVKKGCLTVFCHGHQKADFMHVLDLCQAYELGLKKLDSGQIYNVGSGIVRTYQDLAEEIRRITACKVEYLPCRAREEPYKLYPDIRKLKSKGFNPVHLNFGQLIKEVVSDYR